MSVCGTDSLTGRGHGVELLSSDELFRIVEKENSRTLHEEDFRFAPNTSWLCAHDHVDVHPTCKRLFASLQATENAKREAFHPADACMLGVVL